MQFKVFGVYLHYRRLKVDEFDYDQKCSEIAQIIEGLSGREISKLGVGWQVSQHNSHHSLCTLAELADELISTFLSLIGQNKLYFCSILFPRNLYLSVLR